MALMCSKNTSLGTPVQNVCRGGFRVLVALTLAACGTCQALGGDYYVGGAGASDRNPGTASQPFASIQKAASVAVAGDVVNIREGTYRETIAPANCGAPGKPITFQPDGKAAVTISGADPVDGGWSVHRGKIYEKTIALPLTGYADKITDNASLLANQVFVGGKMMIEARWPNVANSDDRLNRADFRTVPKDGWKTATGTTLQDAAIPDISDGWIGGTIWFIGWYSPQTSTITASSAGQIQFPATYPEKHTSHLMYYLTGKMAALDAEKEWFYDGTKLYLWAPGGQSPTGVEVKRRNDAFDLRGRSNITIRNLRLFAATITTDSGSEAVTVDGLDAQYISHFVTVRGHTSHRTETGLRLMGANSVIRNSTVRYSAGDGIVLGGDGAVAENNLVHDVSYGGTYGCGIWPAPGDARQTITRNTIYRTGRSGIDGVYSNKDIGYNDIYDFGLINTDLGAIYAANGADLTGTRIHHNWLHDAKNDASHQFPVGAGIYFDQNAKPAQVDHNVFWNNHKNDVRVEQGKPPFNRFFNNTMASTEPDFWFTFHSYPASSRSDSRNNIYRMSIKPDTPGDNEMTSETDPRFTNAGNGGLKFRLRADSPAIDRAAAIPGVTDGHVGPAPDLGAYEFGAVDWVAGRSTNKEQ
jgi:hypothetical protein